MKTIIDERVKSLQKEYDDAKWRALQQGNKHVMRAEVEKVAEVCSLEYLDSLERGNRQELVAAMVGHHQYDNQHRMFTLQVSKEGKAQLKKIGKNGLSIKFNGKPLDLSKGKVLTAEMALSLYHEYGPNAEDRAKRGVLVEVVDDTTATELVPAS